MKEESNEFSLIAIKGEEDEVLHFSPSNAQTDRYPFSNPLCLVNLNLLSDALWCNNCEGPLSLRSCIQEKAWRNTTSLKIECHQCQKLKNVLLCNEDIHDESYHDPDNITSEHENDAVENGLPNELISESYVIEETVLPKNALTCVPTRRGRPPGKRSKRTKSVAKQPNRQIRKSVRGRLNSKVAEVKTKEEAPNYSNEEDNNGNIFPEDAGDESKIDDDSEEENANTENSKIPMQCAYCPLNFSYKKQHAKHMKKEHPEVRSFFCEICSEEFTTIYFLRKHKMESHLPKNSPKCETCGKSFLNQDLLSAHKMRHLPKDARQFKCSRCPKKFFEAKRLRVHMLRFHNKAKVEFKCEHCPRGYETKAKLSRHILEHVQDDIFSIKHGGKFSRWKCEYCEKIFKNMGRQLVHMRECHPEFKEFICGWCGERSTNNKSFQKHRRMNHRTDSLYVCDECGKPMLNPKKLKLHKLSHRTDNEGKEFLCSYCPRAFGQNSALGDHIKRFHVITTYYCAHCPKTFKMKFNIQRHMQLHTGEFRHSCQYCGANFVAADGRDHHIRNCHRFMCVLCSSIFPTKEEVVVHRMKEHSSAGRAREGDPIFEKITDYNCEVCYRYLSSKQALNTHLKTHAKRKQAK